MISKPLYVQSLLQACYANATWLNSCLGSKMLSDKLHKARKNYSKLQQKLRLKPKSNVQSRESKAIFSKVNNNKVHLTPSTYTIEIAVKEKKSNFTTFKTLHKNTSRRNSKIRV